MANITDVDVQLVVRGTAAQDSGSDVTVYVPQLTAITYANASVSGSSAKGYGLTVSWSGNAVTVSPAGDVDTGYYIIEAAGY